MGMDNKIFTDNRIGRVLLKFAIPAIISLLVSELYNMVDTVFVGRYIGPNAIAALTVAFPVQRFIIALGLLIAVGASTFVARSLGEQNKKSLVKTIMNALTMTFVILVFISLSVFILKKPIITALGASSVIYPLSNKYVSIILIGGIFQCLGVVACYIMTALGNTKITLYSNSIGAITNIIIDFFLVAILGWGVSGAAIATVFSQIVAFIFAMIEFRKVKKSFEIEFTLPMFYRSLNYKIIFGIMAVGFSTFIIEISDAVVAIILNNLLSSIGGDTAIVIIGAVTRVSMFMFITIIGISSAMQPIVAYNYGSENYTKMKKTLKLSILTVTLASIGFWIILMVFTKPIIGFFLKDTLILSKAIQAFRICISVLPAVGLYYIVIYYYQAIGEAKKSFLLSIYRQMLVFIPLVFIMTNFFGVMGAWLSFPISDMISAITSLFFMKKAFSQKFEKEYRYSDKNNYRKECIKA